MSLVKTRFKGGVRSQGERTVVLDAVTANGYSTSYMGELYASVKVQVLSSGTTAGATITFLSSDDDLEPNWAAALSVTNTYHNDEAINHANTSVGILTYLIATDTMSSFEFNTNGAKWFCIQVSGYADGTYTAWMKGFNL